MYTKRLVSVCFVLGALSMAALSNHSRRLNQVTTVTFNNQVVRILQQHCQVCHHPGDIGPFSLMTYAEARLFAPAIKPATETREMPPWLPAQECSEFLGKNRLTDEEIAAIGAWADGGTPEGNPADLPPALQFTNDWPLGQPDMVLQPDADFSVGLGEDVFRCFSLPLTLRGERFLSAIQIKPGVHSVVHHASVYLDPAGASKILDDSNPAPGYDCGGDDGFMTTNAIAWWAPGSTAGFEADGMAWRIPRGARLVLQVHYHVHHGGAATDRTQVGLYFARTPVRKELRAASISNSDFVIPAGEENYNVTASLSQISDQPVHAIAIAPHMHLLGREISVEAIDAGGATRCLVSIPEWDPHFQDAYRFKESILIEPGTRLALNAFYDNTDQNPDNPHRPPQPVRAGQRTQDEMCLAFIKYTLDAENRDVSSPHLASAAIEDGELIVRGQGFLDGADIEVDGKRVVDTRNHKKAKKAAKILISASEWRSMIPGGRQVAITVLNPDGARSTAITIGR